MYNYVGIIVLIILLLIFMWCIPKLNDIPLYIIIGGFIVYIFSKSNHMNVDINMNMNTPIRGGKDTSKIIYIKLDIDAMDHIRRIFKGYIIKEPRCRNNKCDLNMDDVLLYFPTGMHNFGLQPTKYKRIKYKSRLNIDIVNKETLHRNNVVGLAETYFINDELYNDNKSDNNRINDIKSNVNKSDDSTLSQSLKVIADNEPDSLWIARPTYGFAGSDISYVYAKDFNERLPKLHANPVLNKKFMLSRVIKYPYLMNNRKIHIRRYAFAVADNHGHSRFGLVKNGVIGYARDVYDPNSLDLYKQDTHFKGRELIKFPDDFPTQEYIPKFEQDLINILTPIVKNAHITMYDDKGVMNAFEFLAIDIIIDTHNDVDFNNWDVVILEINHKPGILPGTSIINGVEQCEYPLYDKLKHTHAHYFEYITDTVFGSLKEFIIDKDMHDKDEPNKVISIMD